LIIKFGFKILKYGCFDRSPARASAETD